MSPEKALEGVRMPPLPPRSSIPPIPSGLPAPPVPVSRMSVPSLPPSPISSPPALTQHQPPPPWEASRSPEIGAQAAQIQGEQYVPPPSFAPPVQLSFPPAEGQKSRTVSQEPVIQPYPASKSSAIASMVLGIFVMTYTISFPVFAVISLPISIVGLILGIRSLKGAAPLPGQGKGQAIAGIALSSAGIVAALMIIILFSSMLMTMFSMF